MTEKRAALSDKLAANASQVANIDPKTLGPKQKVSHYLNEMMPSIEAILPKHVTAERMSRIALNVIRTNPKLLECSIESLMGGVMEAAKLGLEPGLMGQCYLIPFEKKKKEGNTWVTASVEAQFIIGYRGLIDLVRRSGQVSSLEARTVHENDHFEFEYGIDDKLVHRPLLGNRGEAIAYYAVAKLKDGGSSFLVMSKDELEKYRDKHSKSKDWKTKEATGPWKDEFDAMARKTCLRQLIKYLPISVEHLSNFDEQSGADVHNEIKNAELVTNGYAPQVIDMEGQAND